MFVFSYLPVTAFSNMKSAVFACLVNRTKLKSIKLW